MGGAGARKSSLTATQLGPGCFWCFLEGTGAHLEGQLSSLLRLAFLSLPLPRLFSLSVPALPCFVPSPRQLDPGHPRVPLFPHGAAAASRRWEPQPLQESVPVLGSLFCTPGRDRQPRAAAWKSRPAATGATQAHRCSQHTHQSAELMLSGSPE